MKNSESRENENSLLRKTIYFSPEEWKSIRSKSFVDEENYSDIVRQAVRKYFNLQSE